MWRGASHLAYPRSCDVLQDQRVHSTMKQQLRYMNHIAASDARIPPESLDVTAMTDS